MPRRCQCLGHKGQRPEHGDGSRARTSAQVRKDLHRSRDDSGLAMSSRGVPPGPWPAEAGGASLGRPAMVAGQARGRVGVARWS